MKFKARIVLDSMSDQGCRLTTMELTYPRFIHSEIMTHRDRERNAASSRAIPWEKMAKNIKEFPVIPMYWGSEQKGMQTGGQIDNPQDAEEVWLQARDQALTSAQRLADLGVHKSLVNRLVEPFMWITTIMTSTSWLNFFRLRVHRDAEIHFQRIASMAQLALETSIPTGLLLGEWHLPYIKDDERHIYTGEQLRMASVARCARVSYLTHDNQAPSMEADEKLFARLVAGSGFGHWSPHGHVAMAVTPDVRSGPFKGFLQYRKTFKNECADPS